MRLVPHEALLRRMQCDINSLLFQYLSYGKVGVRNKSKQ